MGNHQDGKISKIKTAKSLSYQVVICKFCPDFTTANPDNESKHVLFHSIERLPCSKKGRRILELIFENTKVSINDFEELANKILEALEENIKWQFVECIEIVT